MLTALLAARNVLGEGRPGAPHDPWDVNVERSYHEDFVAEGSPLRARR